MPDSPSAPEAPTPAPAGGRSGALLVALGILASRLAGLVRERVFAHYFGSSIAAGAFRAALRIPNILQNLLGEGVLSASFIPVYARLRAEGDHATARKVASAVASLLALVVSVLVALGVALTPWLVDLVAPGFDGEARALTAKLVRILFPSIGLLVMSAFCLGVLNSHRRFFLSYAAPVVWNAAMVAAMITVGALGGQDTLAVALAWGAVIGAGLQLLVQLPFVLLLSGGLRPMLGLALGPVREVLRNLGPVVVSRGVVQLSAYVDAILASFLGTGAVAALGYAQTIYLLPVSLFGMSVAAAELPEMSSATGTPAEIATALRARIEKGLAQIAFFVVPSALALVVIGDALVGALYRTGAFGEDDTRMVWIVLAGGGVGLVATTEARLYASAFYALRDTRTPLRFAIVRVVTTGVLGALCAFPLRAPLAALAHGAGLYVPGAEQGAATLGALGLTASAGVAGWIELLLLRSALEKRLEGRVRAARGHTAKVVLAAVTAALAATATRPLATRVSLPFGTVLAQSLVIIGAFGLTYLALALALRIPEARGAFSRLTRR